MVCVSDSVVSASQYTASLLKRPLTHEPYTAGTKVTLMGISLRLREGSEEMREDEVPAADLNASTGSLRIIKAMGCVAMWL